MPYPIPSDTVDIAGVYMFIGSDDVRCTRRMGMPLLSMPALTTRSVFHWL